MLKETYLSTRIQCTFFNLKNFIIKITLVIMFTYNIAKAFTRKQ